MSCEIENNTQSVEMIDEVVKNSKTVAIVGLSPKEDKDSNKVGRYLQEHGYKIIPIYPKEDEILGEKVYRSLSDIDGEIDIVDIFRNAEAAGAIVDEAIKRGSIKCVWLQLGVVNNEAIKRAEDAGMKAIQNRCLKIEHGRTLS
ncbi:MAG: CoA-binding protein [Campylobacterales bacterium]